MTLIDLNSDMGELPALHADGTQEKIMQVVSSINVSCGAHAGDDDLIAATLAAAKTRGLGVGAHPGYPDRAGFGRTAMPLAGMALSDAVAGQLFHLGALAQAAGVELVHVKPHGALYHEVSKGGDVAEAFLNGVAQFNRSLIVIAFAGSRGLKLATAHGFSTAAEAFMDRAYEPDGTLRGRELPSALLRGPELALAQALSIVERQQVTTASGAVLPLCAQTLCVHSDTPGSATVAAAVSAGLRLAGITIAALPKR